MEEKQVHFKRPSTQRPPSLFNLTILAFFFGLVAGFGGYLLANFIFPSSQGNYFNTNNIPRDIKISIEQPLTNISDKYQKSIAGIYRDTGVLRAIGQPLFSEADFLSSAVVITSDGWLMTTDQMTAINTQAKVVLSGKIYDIIEIKKDIFAHIVFVKIEASLLQPVNFQLTNNLKSGETLFSSVDIANSLKHSFRASFLSNAHYATNKYLFTDEVDYYIKVSEETTQASTAYFNLNGDLVGLSYKIAEAQDLLLPVEYLKQSIKHLLNKTERVSLGVYYIDLENNSGFDRNGALVYNPQFAALKYNSPAYQAGLRVGDQIIAVNNDLISSSQTLTSVLQKYRSGDVVILKILRDKIEQDLELTL